MSVAGPTSRGAAVRLMIYAGITIAAALSTFLTGPVMVRLLGLESFGTWSLIEPLVLTAAVLALLGIDHGLIKQISLDGGELRVALGRLLLPGAPVLLVIAIVAGTAIAFPLLGLHAAPALAALVAAEALLGLLLFGCRAENRLGPYAVGQAGRTVLLLAALSALLLSTGPTPLTIMDVVLLRLVIVASLAVLLLGLLRPAPANDLAAYTDAVRYGGFILLTSLLAQITENSDRFLLAWFSDRELVGSYVVYVKLTAFVGQGITTPFMLWFPVERFRHLNDPDGGGDFFNAAAYVLLALMLGVAGGVALFGRELVSLFAPTLPYDAGTLIVLLMAIVITGMSYPLNVGLLKPGHTHRNLYPVGIGAVAMIVVGAVLIPELGPNGAALAKLIGAGVTLATLIILSQRAHPVAFSFGRMLVLGLGAAALMLLLGPGPGSGWPLALRVGIFSVGMLATIAATMDRRLARNLASLLGLASAADVDGVMSSCGRGPAG